MNAIMTVGCTAVVLLGTSLVALAGDDVGVEWKLTPEKQKELRKMQESCDYPAIARAYADYMIKYGRDRYGKVHSPLFVSILDRKSATVPKGAPYPHVITKPYAPGLRQDHKMRPHDRTGAGANPLQDLPLYGLLYRLTELTGKKRYAEEADKSIAWFLENAQSPATGLYAWGSHVFWNVHTEQAVGWHEYNYVWPYWDRHPEALKRFAHGLWNHQITDQRTGRFSRHADYHKHGPGGEAFEFPQCGACFMDIWAREYGRSGDATSKQALETLLKMYRSLRHPKTGAMSWCSANARHRRENASITMNLYMAVYLQDAAAHVEKRDPELAEDMRTFVRFMEDEYLSNDYDELFDVAVKGILTVRKVARPDCVWPEVIPAPEGTETSVGYPLQTPEGKPAASLAYLTPWFPGRSYAEFSLLLRDRYERCEQKHRPTYRRALLDIADIYMTIGPEVQFAQYPDNISDVVELLRCVYKLTDDVAYLHRADQIMRMGLRLFFDEISPLPKITNFDDWYESSLKNESSVQILRQMLELSLDLEKLPKAQRVAPKVVAEAHDGTWHATLASTVPDAMLRYGPESQHGLYLSQHRHRGRWQINLSDVITRIPTVEEADKLNGRMKRFTGKTGETSRIAYGGFKAAPRNVTLTISNTGKTAVRVWVEATLHDTYHDNGQEKIKKTIPAGQQASFALAAAPRKWIRHLTVTGDIKEAPLELKGISFNMAPRSKLNPLSAEPAAAAPAAPAAKRDYSAFDKVEAKRITDGLVLDLVGDALAKSIDGVAAQRRPQLVTEKGTSLLRFDGKDDFLSIPDSDLLDLKAWTVIALVRATDGPGVVIGKIDERNAMMNYRLQVERDGSVGAVVRGQSAKHQVNRLAKASALNRFAVIAARFDPKAKGVEKITVTVDGLPVYYGYQNAEGDVTALTHDRPLEIGRQPGREPRYFKGDIAGILLYNRSLSDAELNGAARWLFERRPGNVNRDR